MLYKSSNIYNSSTETNNYMILRFIFIFQVTFSLEQICGGTSVFPTPDKTENMIMNLLLPLCLRVGCGSKGMSIYFDKRFKIKNKRQAYNVCYIIFKSSNFHLSTLEKNF